MAHRVTLEVLEAALPREAGADATVVLSADALEDAKLAAFEKGYQAGWDDAVTAHEEEGERLRNDVARRMQELSFTFHEARAHVMRGLAPLMEQICARILPEIARAAIGDLVRDALMPLAEEAADRPVTVLVHPATRRAVTLTMKGLVAPPLEIVDEPAMGAGEVLLRFDGGERHIDIDAAVAAIREAVTAHFQHEQELKAHG